MLVRLTCNNNKARKTRVVALFSENILIVCDPKTAKEIIFLVVLITKGICRDERLLDNYFFGRHFEI